MISCGSGVGADEPHTQIQYVSNVGALLGRATGFITDAL
jgi:hypothetical protein